MCDLWTRATEACVESSIVALSYALLSWHGGHSSAGESGIVCCLSACIWRVVGNYPLSGSVDDVDTLSAPDVAGRIAAGRYVFLCSREMPNCRAHPDAVLFSS